MTERYPKIVSLHGKSLVLRPLLSSDEPMLLALFRRIPPSERALLKDNVSDLAVIRRWCQEIDYKQIYPLLALSGDRVVADATLHRERSGWMRHVAKVRLVVDPDFRGIGLARTLLSELCEQAPDQGIEIVDAEVLSSQPAALKLFEDIGFKRLATLPDHVRDRLGNVHDLIILSRIVGRRDMDTGGGD